MKPTNNWLCILILAASSGIGVVICQPSYGATLYNITANDINDIGQVVGSFTGTGTFSSAFRTQPNSPINPETQLR